MGLLLEHPLGPSWRDDALDQKLRQRLHTSYPFYISIIKRMNHALNDLQSLLGINSGKVRSIISKLDLYALLF